MAFLPGNDLEDLVEDTETLSDAFEFQAEIFERAARFCRRAGKLSKSESNFKIDFGCHDGTIYFDGPENILKELSKDPKDSLIVLVNGE